MLYVAMTRAKRRLAFSATEPFAPPPRPSWWQRVEPVVTSLVPVTTERGEAQARPHPPPTLLVLPRRAARPATSKPEVEPKDQAEVESKAKAKVQTKGRAKPPPSGDLQLSLFRDPAPRPEPQPPAPGPRVRKTGADERAATLGRAVHRVLEWAGQPGAGTPLDELAAAAAREFGVDPAAVAQHAGAILAHPASARFFRRPAARWSGNEVAVSDAGEVLRIDRLVRIEEEGGRAGLVGARLQAAPCPGGARAVPAAVASLP